jgi:hypothetical protein
MREFLFKQRNNILGLGARVAHFDDNADELVPFAGYCTKKQDNEKILFIYFVLVQLPQVSCTTYSGISVSQSARRGWIQTRLLTKCTGTLSTAMSTSQPCKFFLTSLDTVFGNSKLEENYPE